MTTPKEGDAVERVARLVDPSAFEIPKYPTREDAFWRTAAQETALAKARAILATGLVPDEANSDPLDDLVRRFSVALLEKLKAAREKYGYSDEGWRHDDWRAECRRKLLTHLAKGDPRDVAAYCAFMWHHGWSTVAPDEAAIKADSTANLISIIVDIREKTGLGGKPMLNELADAIVAEIDQRVADEREKCLEIIQNLRQAGATNFTDARFAGQRGADHADALYDAYQAIRSNGRGA